MRSRTPLPQRQQAHWGAFLEAAALFLALCVLGRSAALTLAAVVAAPFPAVQTALWWGQRNLQSETSDPEPEPAAEEQDGRDGQNDLAVRAQMFRALPKRDDLVDDDIAVSYTHLTLPTICSV